MKILNFSIDNKLRVKSEIPNDFFLEKNGVSIYVFGDIVGAIIDNDIYNNRQIKKLLKKYITDIDFIKKLIRNSIGTFYIIITQNKKTQILCSYSSPGLFYTTKNKTIFFSNTEKDFFREFGNISQINDKVLLNTLMSHQILLRPPFATVFENIFRLPGATNLIIKNNLDLELEFQLMQEIPEYSYKTPTILESVNKFSFLIENTLKLIIDFYKTKHVELFFSGGIDSSVLMIALKKIGVPFTCRHVAYNGINSQNVNIAKRIAENLKIQIEFLDKSSSPSFEEILATSTSGFGTLNVPQQLNVKTTSSTFGYKDTLNIISGQNADTVYHLDTFAPNSSTFLPLKIINTFRSIPKRLIYSDVFLKNNQNRFYLKYWPFKIDEKKFNSSFKELLINLSIPIEEHISPLANTKEKESKINSIIKKFKYNTVFLPVFNYIKNEYPLIKGNTSSLQKIFLIKVFRWYRTINNVAVNYHNTEINSKLNRIIPFTDAPLVNFFFKKNLSISEMFFIKRIMYIYFKKEVKHNYNFFCKYKLSLLVSILFLKICKIINFNKNKQKPENIIFSKELLLLKNLRLSKKKILLDLIIDDDIKKYFSSIYNMLECPTDQMTKDKMMILCRLVNLENMIYSIKD